MLKMSNLVQSNYDILGIPENSTYKEVREAFRKLALQLHSDRGGEDEEFKKIKQAYEDLKIGKKFPDTADDKLKQSRVYSGDSEEEIARRNRIFAKELSREMMEAEIWATALNQNNKTDVKLFGSKSLGEIEFERKANGALSIKGNFMAGKFTYHGPILMQGNITSPKYSEEHKTIIHLTKGDFKFINPLENKYKIENGATLIVDDGDIIIGNVFGRKFKVPDPDGKVGIYNTIEHITTLLAPKGKIIAENIVNTVKLDADTIIALNLEDGVKISGREILIYGNKITYDVIIELKKNGILRFFDSISIHTLSDDSTIQLENGKKFRLQELKTKKIKDISDEFVPNKENYSKDDTLVGKGFVITYDMLDNFDKKPQSKNESKWHSRFGLKKSDFQIR